MNDQNSRILRPRIGLAHIVLTMVLLLAVVFSLFLTQQKKSTYLDNQVSAQDDSLRLARAYGKLFDETVDLQQELYARSNEFIPVKQVAPDLSLPVLGARQVPSSELIALSESDQRNAESVFRSILPLAADRERINVIYHQRDIESTGASQILTNAGFRLVRSGSMGKQASNAITIGDSVSLESVRAIAYVMIGAGIKVARLRYFEPGTSNAWVVDIGSVSYVGDWPPLGLAQIDRLTKEP